MSKPASRPSPSAIPACLLGGAFAGSTSAFLYRPRLTGTQVMSVCSYRTRSLTGEHYNKGKLKSYSASPHSVNNFLGILTPGEIHSLSALQGGL